MKKNKYRTSVLAMLPLAASLFVGSNARADTDEAGILTEQQKQIEQLQTQIDTQARIISQLSDQVEAISGQPTPCTSTSDTISY